MPSNRQEGTMTPKLQELHNEGHSATSQETGNFSILVDHNYNKELVK
jgi:hypothetical protein